MFSDIYGAVRAVTADGGGCIGIVSKLVLQTIRRFHNRFSQFTKKAPTRAFSWLKGPLAQWSKSVDHFCLYFGPGCQLYPILPWPKIQVKMTKVPFPPEFEVLSQLVGFRRCPWC